MTEHENLIEHNENNLLHNRNKKPSIFFRLFKLLVWIWIIYSIFFYNSYSNFLENKIITTDDYKLKIDSWDTFYSLSEKFWIDNFYLKVYLKLNNPGFNLQAWEYNILKNSNIEDIIIQLKNPENNDEKITILEWWNIYDIDDLLTKKWLIKSWDFINNWWIYEGLFYPDTYNINPNNFVLKDFATKMMDNFDTKVRNNLPDEYKSKQALEELLKLASIVEREANSKDNPEEVAIIAWILKKRLDENWFIWADITVCYPYELTSKECTPSFIWQHITDKNDYNTRTMLWLPKTPIWNPSWKTINATANYKVTAYYYYLHDNNWDIHYARTNEEHINNKNRYLR